MAVQQRPLAMLEQLSEAELELFASQPTFSSTVEAWVKERMDRKVDAGKLRDQEGVATLISNQRVVQLLAAALTTLLDGIAAGAFLTPHQMNAFRCLANSLAVVMQACTDIWVEDKQQRGQAGAAESSTASGRVRCGQTFGICAEQLLRTFGDSNGVHHG
jgi:hypothetical protein